MYAYIYISIWVDPIGAVCYIRQIFIKKFRNSCTCMHVYIYIYTYMGEFSRGCV
jgi:hypothetical protein